MSFKCVSCDKTYASRSSLTRHRKTHDGAVFKCRVCCKIYQRRDYLVKHVQIVHKIKKYGDPYNAAMGIAAPMMGEAPTATLSPPPPPPRTAPQTYTSLTAPLTVTSADTAAAAAAAAPTIAIPAPVPRKRSNDNSVVRVNRKKNRTASVNATCGFVEIDSSFRRSVVWYYAKNVNNYTDYNVFLRSVRTELVTLLRETVHVHPVKYHLKLEATYDIPKLEQSSVNRAFKTSARELYEFGDIDEMVEEDFSTLLAEEDVYRCKGSGYTLACIDGLLLGVYKYTPLGGSSYVPLPARVANRKAVVNPQNIDRECFKWAILAKHVQNTAHCERVGTNYSSEEYRYDFSALSVPTPVSEIKMFERYNPGTSVNVYGLGNCGNEKISPHTVYPLRVVDTEQENHFDLLLITHEGDNHYTFISNFSRLVSTQMTMREHNVFVCKKCFTRFDERPTRYKCSGAAALAEHMKICGPHKPIVPLMPSEGATVRFDAWVKTQRLPFVVYADFESYLRKSTETRGANTRVSQDHCPMSYGFLVKAADGVPAELLERFEIPSAPVIVRGSVARDDVARQFVLAVTEIAGKLYELYKTTITGIVWTGGEEELAVHVAKTRCDLCRTAFRVENRKVAHHDHLSERFLKTLCNTCNLKLKTPNFVPCFLHNLSKYDAHFIVTELGYDTERITVIPNSEETYISFSKYVNKEFTIRFVDTCRFMASKLSDLAANLSTADFSKFREIANVFAPDDMLLVTRKGVFPYEYTDRWDRLAETSLPERFEFFSALKEEHVAIAEHEHAIRVWDHFDCRTLGDYSDLYLKIDVLLLADVFENFRDICMQTYNLDPAYYYTAPGFSFDCMLKYTSARLELLTDYDMLLMIERGIRGGLVQASTRYAKANNAKIAGFDNTQPTTWLVYQDCNNLYGWAMSRYMPYGGFRWYAGNPDVALAQLETMRDTDDVGRVYEVDVSYPQSLHDAHNELPFLPYATVPRGSKVRKLMATLETKKKYVVHYINLKQAIANGLIVDKVHRVLEFSQSPWLAKYIELNTEMRKRAVNGFERDFFKLMNNAVFGKTLESMRKRMKMELVSCERRFMKLVNRPTFKYCTTYNENLAAVSLHNKIIDFCKPIYIGFAVLDISKTLMYDYHYNVMKRHYRENIQLLYTDTDSLVYSVTTNDFYLDLANNPDLLRRMDTSNLPHDHPCYTAVRKKIPGLFTDETCGGIMLEFVALRAKSYAYDIEHVETIRAKGIRHHVIKSHLTMADHKRCLFETDNVVVDDDDDVDDDESDSERQKRVAVRCSRAVVDCIHRQSATATTTTTTTTTSGDDDNTATSLPPYNPYTPYRLNTSIRSFKHQVKTVVTMKKTLNRSDDKRYILNDRVHTLAHGHYSIE